MNRKRPVVTGNDVKRFLEKAKENERKLKEKFICKCGNKMNLTVEVLRGMCSKCYIQFIKNKRWE